MYISVEHVGVNYIIIQNNKLILGYILSEMYAHIYMNNRNACD